MVSVPLLNTVPAQTVTEKTPGPASLEPFAPASVKRRWTLTILCAPCNPKQARRLLKKLTEGLFRPSGEAGLQFRPSGIEDFRLPLSPRRCYRWMAQPGGRL